MSVGQSAHDVESAQWWARFTAFLISFIASIAFTVEVYDISDVNGWWFDELWSLWATDPRMNFNEAVSERIIYDTTPPLYYVVLFLTRRLITDERSAVILLNLGLIVAFAAAIIVGSRKQRMMPWASIAIGAFLCSGPILRYVIEGRAYLMAMVIVFAASWYSALAVKSDGFPKSRETLACLGTVAALTHVLPRFFVAAWRPA
jgi:hypothetical protein